MKAGSQGHHCCKMVETIPLFSVSQFTTWHQSFEEDIALYRKLGLEGIEVLDEFSFEAWIPTAAQVQGVYLGEGLCLGEPLAFLARADDHDVEGFA